MLMYLSDLFSCLGTHPYPPYTHGVKLMLRPQHSARHAFKTASHRRGKQLQFFSTSRPLVHADKGETSFLQGNCACQNRHIAMHTFIPNDPPHPSQHTTAVLYPPCLHSPSCTRANTSCWIVEKNRPQQARDQKVPCRNQVLYTNNKQASSL